MSQQKNNYKPYFLAFLLAIGFAMLWVTLVGWGASVVQSMTRQTRVYENIQVLRDGTPVILKSNDGFQRSRTFSTLDGQQVQIPKYQQNLLTGAQLRVNQKSEFENWYPSQLPVTKWYGRVYPYTIGDQSEEFWYFVSDNQEAGSGYFVAYHQKTKQLIGYLDQNGFRSDMPAEADRIPLDFRMISHGGKPPGLSTSNYFNGSEPYYSYGASTFHPLRIPHWKVFLLSEDNVVEVDLKSRTVKTVLKQPGILSVSLVERASEQKIELTLGTQEPDSMEHDHAETQFPGAAQQSLCLFSGDQVKSLIPGKEKLARTYSLPEKLQGREYFSFYELANETALATYSVGFSGVQEFLWFDTDGTILKEQTVKLKQYYVPPTDRETAFSIIGMFPVPLAFDAYAFLFNPLGMINSGQAAGYGGALTKTISEVWPAGVLLLAVTLVLVWLTWKRQEKYGFDDEKLGWSIFVLVFGVPGYAAYRMHRSWPVLLECESCSQPVPRDRKTCSRCSSEFPLPELKGTEVFA